MDDDADWYTPFGIEPLLSDSCNSTSTLHREFAYKNTFINSQEAISEQLKSAFRDGFYWHLDRVRTLTNTHQL